MPTVHGQYGVAMADLHKWDTGISSFDVTRAQALDYLRNEVRLSGV